MRLQSSGEPGLSSSQSDSDLKHQLLNDNEAVLGLMLRLYGPAVATSLRRRYFVLNEQDIEDILAAALYRLWTYRKRLDITRGAVAVLFYRIAENTVRNLFKSGWHKVRLQEVTLDDAAAFLQALESVPVEGERSNTGKIQKDVQEIIDTLPAPYRYIVIADATAKDRVASADLISEELEIPVGTVRVYRNRAMAAIRRELRIMGYEVPEAAK